MKIALGCVTLALATFTAGCGGGDSTAAPSASPAESAPCRTTMASVGDLARQMQTTRSTDAQGFHDQFARLQALRGRAGKSCSETVTKLLDLGADKMSSADASFTACQFETLCSTSGLARKVVAGSQQMLEGVDAANRKS